MGNRLSKIYTRTGDAGETGLGDGSRVSKDSARVQAYGSVDELNSLLGMVLALAPAAPAARYIPTIQHRLFDLGAELCVPDYAVIIEEDVKWLEAVLDHFNADMPPLKDFILPAGNAACAQCHVARTVCRRAERDMVALSRDEKISAQGMAFINRLSDLLFVLARAYARADGGSEVLWHQQKSLPWPESP